MASSLWLLGRLWIPRTIERGHGQSVASGKRRVLAVSS
jgi:hypothetical protein